jgi:membrane protease YdiL (CAAX protease family)
MESDTAAASRSKVTWGPIAAIIVTVAVYFGAQVLGGVLISLYTVARGWSIQQADAWFEASTLAKFALYGAVSLGTLLLLYLFLHSRHAHPHDIGLKKPRPIDAVYAGVGFLVYFLLYSVVLGSLPKLLPQVNVDQRQDLGFSTGITGNGLLLVFVSLVLLPPIVEEILMRGFLYTGLRTRFGIAVSMLITSVLFAIPHLQLGSGNPPLYIAAIDTFTLSLVLVYLRERTDSLWASIGLHGIKNFLAFTYLFVVPVLAPSLVMLR